MSPCDLRINRAGQLFSLPSAAVLYICAGLLSVVCFIAHPVCLFPHLVFSFAGIQLHLCQQGHFGTVGSQHILAHLYPGGGKLIVKCRDDEEG